MNRTVLFFLGFIFGVGFYAIVINTKIKFVEMAEEKEMSSQSYPVNRLELMRFLSASDALLHKTLDEIQQTNMNSPTPEESLKKAIELLRQAQQVVDDHQTEAPNHADR